MSDTEAPIKGQVLTEKLYESILVALDKKPAKVAKLIEPLHPADIADLMERMQPNLRDRLASFIPHDHLGEVLSELSDGVQEHILQGMEAAEVVEAVADLETDDIADIVQHLDEGQAEETIDLLDRENQKLLKYDADTAGGLMQLELVSVRENASVSEFIEKMRAAKEDEVPHYIGTVFVVDNRQKLIGVASLSHIIKSAPHKKIKSIMRKEPVTIKPSLPQEEVATIFEKYDIHSCAVVNQQGVLLGRITIHDVLDVIIEEQDKDVMRAAGLSETDDLFSPVSQTTRRRFPWLVLNLFTAVLASMVIAMFEGDIQQLVALAVLMPIVASMGGNAGTQTLTVTVRGLATKQITMKNAFYLLRKELLVGGFTGLFLGALLAVMTVVAYGNWQLAQVILAATFINHVLAALAGHYVPIFLQKMGKDPAISSGVLVTTVTDVCGFFVFLGLASLILM